MRPARHLFGRSVETLESPFLDEEIVARDSARERDAAEEYESWPIAREARADRDNGAAGEAGRDDFESSSAGWEVESFDRDGATDVESAGELEEALFEELDDRFEGEFDAEGWTVGRTREEAESDGGATRGWPETEAPFLEGEVLARDSESTIDEAVLTEAEAADTTLANERLQIDPDYVTGDGETAPPVWQDSDRIRFLIEKKGDPDDQGRVDLATAVTRQLKTVVLYARVFLSRGASRTATPDMKLSLYVLLFPGETKDNTGIKDLNDKTLRYQLNLAYTRRRQEEIAKLFPVKGTPFVLVGQDYKTASILAPEGMRQEFAKRLAQLDARLRDLLLEFLEKARKEEESKPKDKRDRERLEAIADLEKTLKPKDYKFDIFFGLSSVDPRAKGLNVIDVVFLLVTESLKGAGIAKVIAKGRSLKKKEAAAFTKDMKPDDRALDSRGKEYQPNPYLAATRKAGDIKALVMKKPNRDRPADYYHILVDTVWTTAFFPYRRWFVGNPDVIRDVRKKLLEKPRVRDGNIKYWFEVQKELLELWLVFLNMLDFVKDFLSREFRKELVAYHDDASASFLELTRRPPEKLDWPRLERVLTRDLRQTERIAVLGTASEFQFYSVAADYPDRIFFSMDIRDLGVALMLLYEDASEDIEDRKPTGVPLMERTFKAADAINVQRRFMYDKVVEVFKKYFTQIGTAQATKVAADARPAFGTDVRPSAFSDFRKCVQIMLGGDEIFVAAHGYFEPHVHKIIGDLANVPISESALNVRTAVAYSRTEGDKPSRKKIQESHQNALMLADAAPATLKRLEGTYRRIERLIDKLEANPKKKDLAPPHRKDLEQLGLKNVFARVRHGKSSPLTPAEFKTLVQLLKAGDAKRASATGEFDLVDFKGNVVDSEKLEAAAAKLEEVVRRKVGTDNIHVDPHPVTKMPKWIEKWLDDWVKKP